MPYPRKITPTMLAMLDLGYEFDENGKLIPGTKATKEDVTPTQPTIQTLPKQEIKFYKEGKQDDGSYNLPEVTVTAEQPKSYMGIPTHVYSSPTYKMLEEDRNKAGRDIALGMATVATAPAVVPAVASAVSTAAPYVASAVNTIGKVFTPSTYTNWIVPRIAARFGASAPTTAKLTSLIGAGADMGLAGYFAHEGYKGVKEALQHPENLLSWTDYGKIGLDALMTISPFSLVGRTASALNKGVRIPFLINARYSNRYFNWANNIALKLNSYLDNHNFSSERQRKVRSFFYKPLNFVAGLELKSKSWLSAIKEAAKEGVQTSMNIFDKNQKPFVEMLVNHPIDVGKAEDYVRNMNFSYIPWDRWGFLFNTGSAGHTMRYPLKEGFLLSEGKLPVALDMGVYLRHLEGESGISRLFRNMKGMSPKVFKSDAVHETNHAFTLDPALEKSAGDMFFGPDRTSLILDEVYEYSDPIRNIYDSAEKSATNAEIRHLLGLTPEEILKLPTEAFARFNKRGNPITIFDTIGIDSDYAKDFNKVLKEKLRNSPNFAEEFARNMKEALLTEYKQGGRL